MNTQELFDDYVDEQRAFGCQVDCWLARPAHTATQWHGLQACHQGERVTLVGLRPGNPFPFCFDYDGGKNVYSSDRLQTWVGQLVYDGPTLLPTLEQQLVEGRPVRAAFVWLLGHGYLQPATFDPERHPWGQEAILWNDRGEPWLGVIGGYTRDHECPWVEALGRRAQYALLLR